MQSGDRASTSVGPHGPQAGGGHARVNSAYSLWQCFTRKRRWWKHPGRCVYVFLSPSCLHFLHKGHNLPMPAVRLQTGPSSHCALGSQTRQNPQGDASAGGLRSLGGEGQVKAKEVAGCGETLTCMMLLRRGWRLLRYSFFTSISLRIFSLLDRHSRYFSASLLREDRALSWDALQGQPNTPVHHQTLPNDRSHDELLTFT